MKYLILLLLCTSGAMLAGGDTFVGQRNDNDQITEANMNAYIDYIMIQVGPWMIAEGWIPMPLPDIEEEFEGLVTKGTLNLWDGSLDRFDGVVRQGNAMMYYDRMLLRVAVGAALKNIRYRYDYKAKYIGIPYDGWLEGGTDRFVMYADFMIDITDFYIYMQDFRVDKIGSVWTKLHGNVLTDWLANAIINTMTFIFRGTLRDFISETFRQQVQAIIDDINNGRTGAARFQSVEEVQNFLHEFAANGFQKPINY